MSDFPTHLSVEEAQTFIIKCCGIQPLPPESLSLQAAHGRILHEDVIAARDLPPFANSAMDGFALRALDLPQSGERRLRLRGTRLAGDASPASLAEGECLRITTGAPMPAGADSVVIKERVSVEGDSIIVRAGEVAGAHVRVAGEEFRAGERVMRRGQRIRASRIGALASMGLANVSVHGRPRVSIMTTGDELVMPGSDCGPAQIFNSNGYALVAMLDGCGVAASVHVDAKSGLRFRHLADDRETIRAALREAARSVDVIITSGGVSAGEVDHLPGLLAEEGRVHFWKVRMRPGMPFLFGQIGRTWVFCLPGNPVSTIATFLCLVRPALAAMQGAGEAMPKLHPARLAAAIDKRHDRAEFLRGACEVREDGVLWVTPMTLQGSSMQRGLIDADSLIALPEASRRVEAGEIVRILPLPDVS